jgi:hypothetical protein
MNRNFTVLCCCIYLYNKNINDYSKIIDFYLSFFVIIRLLTGRIAKCPVKLL